MAIRSSWCVCALALAFFCGAMADAAPRCLLRLNCDSPDEAQRLNGRVVGGSFVEGRNGKAWLGRGGDDRIEIPNTKRFLRDAGTIEMFFKVDAPNEDEGALLLFDTFGKPNWWNRYFGRLSWKQGRVVTDFGIVADKQVQFACDLITRAHMKIEPGLWHHYAATWANVASGENNSEMRLFIDGVEVARLPDQSAPVTSMGKRLWFGNAIHKPARAKVANAVALDDIRVWSEPLAASRIAEIAGRDGAALKADAVKPGITIRPVVEPPQMDGDVTDKTWQYAQTLSGFRNFHDTPGLVVPLQPTFWLAYDAEHLYMAWRCPMPGVKPKGEKRAERDKPIFRDDSVEILFASPEKPDDVFHFIGDAYGSILDEVIGLEKAGAQNRKRKWDLEWNYRTTFVPEKSWSGEIKIAFADLGIKAPKIGDAWKLNIAHNGFEPEYQSDWTHSMGGYAVKMGALRFAGPGPVICEMTAPELILGENLVPLRLADSGKTVTDVQIEMVFDGVASLWRRASQPQFAPRDVMRVSLPKIGRNPMAVRITEPATGVVLYEHSAIVEALPPLQVLLKPEFPKGIVNVTVDAEQLGADAFSGQVALLTEAGETLKTVAVKTFRGSTGLDLPIDGVPAGAYLVEATVSRDGAEPVSRREPLTLFAKPDCSSSTAGKGGLIAPWTPMSTQGTTVKCWNREYAFGDGAFPRSIRSGGEELFSAKPRFVWKAGDARGVIQDGEFKITHSDESKVSFEGRMEDARFDVRFTGDVEFDGAVFYDMKVRPKRFGPIDDFALEFSLTPAAAKYYIEHHSEYASEAHNVLPDAVGSKRSYGFKNMVAVCGDGAAKGLLFYCESDEGWTPYDREDTITLERRATDVLWRFNIKANSDFKGSLNLKCGFLATPIKPLQKTTAAVRSIHYWPGGPLKDHSTPQYNLKFLEQMHARGYKLVYLHQCWPKYFGGWDPYNTENLKKFVDQAHTYGMRVCVYLSGMGYWGDPGAEFYGDDWPLDPRTAWKSRSWERPELGGIVRCAKSESYRDWLCGGIERMLKTTGVDGLYYDWGCGNCRNGRHGCGYLPKSGGAASKPKVGASEVILGMAVDSLAGPYSKYRRTAPYREHRELWQRLYRIVKTVCGPDGNINIHCDIPSHMVYSIYGDSHFYGEDVACHMPKDWIPEPWYYRFFLSRKFLGMRGELIAMSELGPWRTIEKSLAMSLVHGEWTRGGTNVNRLKEEWNVPIRKVWKILDAFGSDEPDATWRPYWSNQAAVASSDPKALVSYWQRPGKALFVVSNWSNEPRTVTVTIKDAALLPGKLIDQRSGKPVALNGNSFSVSLEKTAFGLITLEK